MTQLALIYPMAAMVLLTIVVLYRMVRGRFAAVSAGEVDARLVPSQLLDSLSRSDHTREDLARLVPGLDRGRKRDRVTAEFAASLLGDPIGQEQLGFG